jgi:TPR repeat protein
MINQQNFLDQCMLAQGWEERDEPAQPVTQPAPQTNSQRALAAYGAKDYAQAMLWWRKSADMGDAEAQSSVGWMYLNGFGVSRDYSQAMLWFKKAADQGNAIAENNVGSLYRNGFGVPKDNNNARYWFLLAAAQGEPNAKASLDQLDLERSARDSKLGIGR